MGDMADWTNEQGFDAACAEQNAIDAHDVEAMFEMGVIDHLGYMDMGNPPGLIGMFRASRAAPSVNGHGSDCPKCGQPLTKRTNGTTHETFIGCTGFPKCRFSQ